MKTINLLFLMAAIGVIISLAGLVWDAQIHIHEHGSLVVEALINLSEPAATNPGHLVFGLGFLLTSLTVLGGFSMTWVQMQKTPDTRTSWCDLSLPLALSIALGLIGIVAVYYLGQVG